MKTSLFEKLWLAAALAFVAYPIGDLLGFWDIEAAIVLVASVALLIAGRNVGNLKMVGNG